MMIEDLIRAAQQEQAGRAVPESRVLAGLRPARRRRTRRLALASAAGAALAAAAIVAVPVFVLPGPAVVPPAPLPPAAAPPSPSALPSVAPTTVAPFRGLPLGYRPGWVPDGFAEHLRQAWIEQDAFGPTLMRVWKTGVGSGDPWGGTALSLYVRTAVDDPAASMDRSGQRVDVGGHDGWYTPAQGDSKSSVNWVIGEHTVLTLAASHLDIAKADLLRMARSVRPESGVSSSPLTLNWLPDGWTPTSLEVSGPSAQRWRTAVTAVKTPAVTVTDPGVTDPAATDPAAGKEKARVGAGEVTVTVGESTDAPDGGRQLTVAGRPARQPQRTDEAGKGLLYLVVDLGGGRLLTLTGTGLTLDDATRIAEQLQIRPDGLDWLGR
ncbi:hypothetical protein [Actinoplanes sp. NPDC023714]|uniref:hypothetical protein n=1 Tax=Actinoplanes sp. NPDC023714 TaxID=3154322 RepID=UPI0033C2F1AF